MTSPKLFLFLLLFLILPLSGLHAQHPKTHEPGQLIVQLADTGRLATVLSLLRNYKGRPTKMAAREELCRHPAIWLLGFDPAQVPEEELRAAAAALPGVTAAQYNHYLSLRSISPDDPLFPAQWHWHNSGADGSLPDADVDAPEAWQLSSGGVTPDGDTIVVAMIDDGLRLQHPDLSPNLWRNYGEIPNNGIDDDGNGYPDDYFGWNAELGNGHVNLGFHGTQVAGILAARANNGIGGTGIAGQARIMAICGGSGLESEVIQAYAYALAQRRAYNQTHGQKGAFIVATNSSWGADGLSYNEAPVWCDFYRHLGQAGMLNCAATANRDWNIDEAGDMPTSCPSPFLLSVTASDDKDQRGASAYGPTHVDLAAPGIEVVTTSPGASYTTASGTSFASPLTAGIVALLYAAPCPGLSALAKARPEQAALLARQLLLTGVDTLSQFQGELASGGRANARKSLVQLLAHCRACPAPAAFSVQPTADGAAWLDWKEPGASLYWRRQGDRGWISLGQPQPPYRFEGLYSCSVYEFMLVAHCPEADSWPSLATLQTAGCCPAPASASLVEATTEMALVSWAPSEENASSILQLWAHDELLTSNSTEDTSYTFTGLSACSDYSVLLISDCPAGQADTLQLPFRTTGCGACVALAYCPSAAQPHNTEWIESFSIGSYHNNSGMDDGYGDFTHLPIRLQAGQTYPFTIEPGFLHIPFPEYYRIWADLDQDGQFAGSGELLFETPFSTEGPVSGNITLPEITGSIRLRLSMKWGGNDSTPPQACEADMAFGEVEDYCISIEACAAGCLPSY